MNIKEQLNEKQYEAATTIDRHLRIIAGAGSGKTRVITYRIAYLIEEVGIDPRSILAITFTNKAANEMKERVQKLLGQEQTGSTICTIHSLCVRILRDFIYLIGYPRFFVIMDTDDQKSVLKDIYKELEIGVKQISYNSALRFISSCKFSKVSVEDAKAAAEGFIAEYYKALIYEKYLEYQDKHYCLDFDDLLLKTEYLFKNFPVALETWQRKFQYIHVDEFQDVSRIEYEIIHYLTGEKNILCVVGDPDQTIYSFRGADVNYILDLEKDYPNIQTVVLNENYRSTKTILQGANTLIHYNHNRIDKDLFTKGEAGENIIHYCANSDELEAQFVVEQINDIINKVDGVNYRDFAILYRANYLSRAIEQELIRNKMDYRIFGGVRFTDRREVKDVLCYMRAIVLKDDLAITRIYNVPGRSVGPKSFEKVKSFCTANNLTLYDGLKNYVNQMGVRGKALQGLKQLIQLLEYFQDYQDKYSLVQFIDEILVKTGYMQMLEVQEEENRIENIYELKTMAQNFSNDYDGDDIFMDFLMNIPLGSSQDYTDDDQYISLMSIHMAKGLEFNYVFVLGLSDNIFPSNRALEEAGNDGLEEERRLAYVAFTRAKRKLFLTENHGYSYVTQGPKQASQFVSEVGTENVTHVGMNRLDVNIPFQGSNRTTSKAFEVGEHIMHDMFGEGVVLEEEGDLIRVAFAYPNGIKVLMKNHNSIKKITN